MRKNVLRKLVAAVLLLGWMVAVASADVKLPGIFANHMVLQRETSIPIWGLGPTPAKRSR